MSLARSKDLLANEEVSLGAAEDAAEASALAMHGVSCVAGAISFLYAGRHVRGGGAIFRDPH